MSKSLIFEVRAYEDLMYWSKNDLKLIKRIFQLIENILQTPFEGIGKPEALKHALKGYWSRRINDEHRLVYKVTDTSLIITSCRFHYDE